MTIKAKQAAFQGRAYRPAEQAKEAFMALSSFSAGIVAKFSTVAGGAWIEQEPTPYGTTRVWRFDDRGNAEWACLADLKAGGRFYGSSYTQKDFVLC